jgi:hypothetical protein
VHAVDNGAPLYEAPAALAGAFLQHDPEDQYSPSRRFFIEVPMGLLK